MFFGFEKKLSSMVVCLQGGGQPALPEPDIPAVTGAGGRRQQQAPAGHRPPQQLHPLAARHAMETQQS